MGLSDKLHTYDWKAHIHNIYRDKKLYRDIKEYPKHYTYRTSFKRLDLIAWELCDDPIYWELLAVYNDIKDPFKLPEEIFVIPKEHLMAMVNGEDWKDIELEFD